MNYYSTHLAALQFNGDICDYLNITATTKRDVGNLTSKFEVLDSMELNSVIGWLFLPFIHQMIVAKCAFLFKVQQVASDYYRDNVMIYFTKYGHFSPIPPWIIVPNMVVIVSVLFNINLVVVTVTKLKDRKTCNWLLALDSCCQILSLLPFLVNLTGVLFRINPMDYRICLATLMLSTITSFASFMAIYLISLERLLIVAVPLLIKRWSTRSKVCKHSLIATLICTVFGLAMNYTVFNVWTIINIPFEELIQCNTGLYSDVLNTPVCYVVLLLAVLNYAAIFGIILWRHFKIKISGANQSDSNADQSMRRMLRSVFILLTVVLIGWLVASAARNKITDFIGNYLPLFVTAVFAPTNGADQGRIANNINVWLISFITCMPLMASASGPIILFFSSAEYRDAYKQLLKPKPAAIDSLCSNNKIVVSTNMIQNGFVPGA